MIRSGDSSKNSNNSTKETEKCLDPQLWHACAGGMVQMPTVNSKVYYFPQGHAEHASGNIDFSNLQRIPSFVLCRVVAVTLLADPDNDEVFANIRLVPARNDEYGDSEENGVLSNSSVSEVAEKPVSFAKTLTQSDANNGGGFSVPRYCAETIFPRLDYSSDPPVQTILARDVHGNVWKFRHIYRGTPRRHLLTTGWSTFVNQKKLIAGDSIVFLRSENGDLCVGIRRATRAGGKGGDSLTGWNLGAGNCGSPFGGFPVFVREDDGRITRCGNGMNSGSDGCLRARGGVSAESVVEAVTLAASGRGFQVVYYPRASTPEFCVKAVAVNAGMRIQWCPGMRFKMAFETEDSSRISWFMGTISSVQVADPIRWPNSPWRLLQVTWDEPDLLQNVKRVSPWLVELVSNIPTIQLTPFSPPRKKFRPLQHPGFPFDGQLSAPLLPLPGNPLGPTTPFPSLLDNTPAGIQGARHAAQFGISLTNLHLNKLQSSLFPAGFRKLDSSGGGISPASARAISTDLIIGNNTIHDISSSLTIQSSSQSNKKMTPQLILFGQPILTAQQLSETFSSDSGSPVPTGNSSTDGNPERTANFSDSGLPENSSCEGIWWHRRNGGNAGAETGHCKVFLESEDVGRTLDLTLLSSYEELHARLARMFGIERFETLSHVLYRDANGAVKRTGDQPFSEFTKTVRRLTILIDSGSDNIGR